MNDSRRDFLAKLGYAIGGSMFISSLPWFSQLKAQVNNGNLSKVKLAIIGTGSRGQLLQQLLMRIPEVEIAALCDIYEPHLKKSHELLGKDTKLFTNYQQVLELKEIQGVIVATSLHTHAEITIAALQSGKHVFCEKSMARHMEDCKAMVMAQKSAGKHLQIGHQRLFNIKYLQGIERIQKGEIGKVVQIRAFWHRNNDWRRHVPTPELERFLNWRLYKEYSCGLLTELASHQIQVANWIWNEHPQRVMGSGSVAYWNDGREVPDNVALILDYKDGKKLIWDSVISSAHYGLEEQIQGDIATMELEKNIFYPEEWPPAPGIKQLIHNIENSVFDKIPIGGATWVPETAADTDGWPVYENPPKGDGTDISLEAFVAYVRENKADTRLTHEGYYATIATLLAHEAIEQGKILEFPSDYIIEI